MKKRFKYRYWFFPIAVCAIIILIAVMNTGDKKAGIEGNKVDFRYPSFCVKLLMGEPDEKTRNSEFDETVYCYYDRAFFGKKCSIKYFTCFFQVNGIILKIDTSDDEAFDLFSTISQSIENEYKDKAGFYCGSIEQKENGELTQEMGVNKGATGISFRLKYKNGTLVVDGYYIF